ncbi:hypothetical protein [Conexibacter woesei]|uniref:hypothetical protein n=1 Tax=Conexibacter woesei TaxID=191495 RepID=UPI0004152786|nr:hypothetical protein [Conexibacter woesei]
MSRRLVPLAACAIAMAVPAAAHADVRGTLFEPPDFTAGQSFTGHDGWTQATLGQDHQIVANPPGSPLNALFGDQSLRISNAVTSPGLIEQTRSADVIDGAGERAAANGGKAGGVRRTRYVASLRFASADLATTATPAQQPGLDVAVSPDNGGGGRMGYARITDEPDGLKVIWTDYTNNAFADHVVATGLSRNNPHLLVIALQFNDGAGNDVARVAVDGHRAITATTWEDYFRSVEHRAPPAIDELLFQTRSTAVPALAGHGLLFDDVRVATPVFYGNSGTIAPPAAPTAPAPSGAQTPPSTTVDGASDPSPLQIRSAHLDRKEGTAKLVLYCPKAAGLCEGTATIRANHHNLASKGFNQKGGAKFPVTIKLSTSVRHTLASAPSAQALLLSRDAAGMATRLTRTFER